MRAMDAAPVDPAVTPRCSPQPHALTLRQDIDEDAGVAAVHEAFALGINLFDTSPFYGNTRSETVRAFDKGQTRDGGQSADTSSARSPALRSSQGRTVGLREKSQRSFEELHPIRTLCC